MIRLITGLILISLALAAASETKADTFGGLVDDKGNISLPENYRTEWAYLGSYFVQSEPAASMSSESAEAQVGFDAHTVFTQPSSAEYYREHGEFPDGAVLVKDVNGTHGEALTTGFARYEGAPKVIFVMVKDKNNRFPSNQAWGEGWGWALFTPGETRSQTTNWKGDGFNNCFGCHLPVKDQDWVYSQGYGNTIGKR